jgi:hypothetical protein
MCRFSDFFKTFSPKEKFKVEDISVSHDGVDEDPNLLE